MVSCYVSVNAGNGRGRRREVKRRDSMGCYISSPPSELHKQGYMYNYDANDKSN